MILFLGPIMSSHAGFQVFSLDQLNFMAAQGMTHDKAEFCLLQLGHILQLGLE